MSNLKFDMYAMVEPKSRADVQTLLAEALVELQHVNTVLDDILNTPHRPTPGN